MGHDTHSHDTHHTEDKNPGSSFTSGFWVILILAGLFIASVNFINVMSHDEGGHGEGGHEATEQVEHSGHGNVQHQEAAPNHSEAHKEEAHH